MSIFHILNDIINDEYHSIKFEPQLLIEIMGDLNSAVIEEMNHSNTRLNLKELRMGVINKPRHFRTCVYCDTDSYIIRDKKGEIRLTYQKRYQGDYNMTINDSVQRYQGDYNMTYSYHSKMFIINTSKTLYHRGIRPHTLTLSLQIVKLNISESEETYCDNGDLLNALMKKWKEYINNFIINEGVTTCLTIKFFNDLVFNLTTNT